MVIRNQPTVRWTKRLRKSSVTIYAAGFLLAISFLAVSYRNGGVAENPGVALATQNSYTATGNQQATKTKISVDQLAAASAVTNLAEATNLPVAGDLREATTTLYIKKQLAQSDAEVISKPQIVQPTTSSERGVTTHVVAEGENLATIAEKYSVSPQTLRWANNTTSDSVAAGQSVTVPLVDGVLYTIKDGDSLESLAGKYGVDAERVMLYNDLEAEQTLPVGTQIVLPNGDLPETERPGYVAPQIYVAPVYNSSSVSNSYGSMSGSILDRSYGFAGPTFGNRYAAGNCTWYAYERRAQIGRPIGGLWGNAYSWAMSARSAGYVVNNTPAVGAVIQSSSGGGGYGHVGVVERIEGENIVVSDMNYAGYNVVTWRVIPISQAGSFSYIH